MNEFLNQFESVIRLGVFLGGFALLAIWEIFNPQRHLSQPRLTRWWNNIWMVVCGSLMVRFIFPTAAVGIAAVVEANHWGLLYYNNLPQWAHWLIAFILLDLSLYFQHVMFHTLPLLWRFHRVHHSDMDVDVTTGLRFHPGELLLSMLVKFMAIVALGAPVVAVVIFEIMLNAMSMFTHSNIKLISPIERVIRWFIVTPPMHRIHHSALENETNSNFGFNLSLWDRLFGTYTKEPARGHENMTLGLYEFRESRWKRFAWLIYMPFIRNVRGYAINQRARQ